MSSATLKTLFSFVRAPVGAMLRHIVDLLGNTMDPNVPEDDWMFPFTETIYEFAVFTVLHMANQSFLFCIARVLSMT